MDELDRAVRNFLAQVPPGERVETLALATTLLIQLNDNRPSIVSIGVSSSAIEARIRAGLIVGVQVSGSSSRCDGSRGSKQGIASGCIRKSISDMDVREGTAKAFMKGFANPSTC
jgi:hypothetical protein